MIGDSLGMTSSHLVFFRSRFCFESRGCGAGPLIWSPGCLKRGRSIKKRKGYQIVWNLIMRLTQGELLVPAFNHWFPFSRLGVSIRELLSMVCPYGIPAQIDHYPYVPCDIRDMSSIVKWLVWDVHISLMSAEQSVWIAEQRFVWNYQESALDFTYYRILSKPLFFQWSSPA